MDIATTHTQNNAQPSPIVENVSYSREEEYLSAQRAAFEAITIGRETLETAQRQGEQLRNADQLADATEYKLDKATRLLKNMTWSGWLANKFTKDVVPPEYQQSPMYSDDGPPKAYEDVPEAYRSAAQSVQNYYANLQVLETCETEDQIATCWQICENMFQQANKEVMQAHTQWRLQAIPSSTTTGIHFSSRLRDDLSTLRKRQEQLRGSQGPPRTKPQKQPCNPAKSELFHGKAPSPPSSSGIIQQQQDDHLEVMGQNLEELGSLAANLNESFAQHSNTLESLDEKNDSMLFKSKMVTRRADRIIQNKSWVRPKAEFEFNASIRHVKSGKYLSISPTNGGLELSTKYNETCIFGIWKRQGSIFGLQSKYSRRWIGQNLLGNLVCSANRFDRREEWDADEDWTSTALLCASAGWGNGGYLLVRPDDHMLVIGGGGLADKKIADRWSIAEHREAHATQPVCSTEHRRKPLSAGHNWQ